MFFLELSWNYHFRIHFWGVPPESLKKNSDRIHFENPWASLSQCQVQSQTFKVIAGHLCVQRHQSNASAVLAFWDVKKSSASSWEYETAIWSSSPGPSIRQWTTFQTLIIDRLRCTRRSVTPVLYDSRSVYHSVSVPVPHGERSLGVSHMRKLRTSREVEEKMALGARGVVWMNV